MTLLEGIFYMIWRGFAIGIIISAPMGPVGILCLQRTLEKGRATGFFTGVGASISDLFYCLLTGFGLSFIEDFLKANQSVIQVFGSVVLILFGIYLFRSHPARKLKKPDIDKSARGKNVLGGFLFTISNPLIIFLIIGLFARFDFFLPEISFGLYVIGYVFIILGALFWWWLVTFFVDKVRAHFNLRSMWLVNKITGAIIMIFAVVGIVTAFSSVSEAMVRQPVYLNSVRGFGALDDTNRKEGALVITNETSDTLVRMMPLERAGKFRLVFRAANLNNRSGSKYKFADSDGKTSKVSNPAWGMVLKSGEKTARIIVSTHDPRFEDISGLTLDFNSLCGDAVSNASMAANVGFYTDVNSFEVSHDDGRVSLRAGNRNFHKVFENLEYGFIPDSLGFLVAPGGRICLDDISLEIFTDNIDFTDNRWSHFGNPDVRKSYFMRSADAMEGEWEIFDRMLEDKSLRLGGNYRLACVRSDEGYDLIYLDGAMKNAGFWLPGMTKAILIDTSFSNTFDVEWLDPAGRVIDGEIKAQFQSPDIITLLFPGHDSSTLRLRKISSNL